MRLIGYVRVSRVGGRDGDSFISPDVQRERMAAYAAAHGHIVEAFESDLDVSGGTMRRPGFDRAMRAIEAGKAEGLIVAKLDRFSRTLEGALAAVRRLDEAGAVLVSCADQLDASTPTGKAMFRMLLVIAELQRDMASAEWAESRAKAIDRGVHIATHTPRGYVRGVGGRLEPNPESAPAVAAAFEARAAGASWSEIAEPLGVTRQGARSLIANRVYLGESHNGVLSNPDAHAPLVSRELYEQANAARGVTRARGRGHLLSGIARCASCRHALSGNGRSYKCTNDACSARAGIKAETLEANVRALYAVFITAPAEVESEAAGELVEALQTAEAELTAFVRIMRAAEPGFREGLEARQAVVAEARRQLAAAAKPELVAIDEGEPIAEQRRKLARAIVAVFVRKGTGSVVDRCRLVWSGSSVDLPSRGARGEALPAFAF